MVELGKIGTDQLFSGTPLPGVRIFSVNRFIDSRGWFSQLWTTEELKARYGWRSGFVQANMSFSKRGVLRGMHRQDQSKLLTVMSGSIFDVALDVETGAWMGMRLDAGYGVLIPPKYAHGFFVTSDEALVQYLVDAPYNREMEEVFPWNGYGIQWPVSVPVLSDKDREAK